ncbi:DUF1631 family protein [Oleiagrimonas sp. C23AA]|uniref:DUF1631 family protein n=1 Tax=Oleiagrimonas sp. C23AA TaxID=2719047 RepID=UPI00141DAB5D|nr:DUF1631 family protein [Oleiagrimonas sp. C23AA]NII09787.1 DUF1631 domain-containing protein [Oleiagrimonas sp. C23AA]
MNRDTERSPTASAGTPLAPRARHMLGELRTLCLNHIEPHIPALLDELCEQLFRRADQSFNNADQQQVLHSLRMVKHARSHIAQRFAAALDEQVENPGHHDLAPAIDHPTRGGLSLVDPEQFEEHVLLDEIAARINARASMPLFELGYRCAALMACSPLDPEELPLGPKALLGAWHEATDVLDLPSAHRIMMHRVFEQQLIDRFAPLYEQANVVLLRQRVLPNLRAALSRRPGSADTRPQLQEQHAATSENAPRPSAGTRQNHQWLDELSGLLQQRRSQQGKRPPAAAGAVASDQQVQQALDALQHLHWSTPRTDGEPAERTLEHIRQDLSAQLRQSGDGRTPTRLSRSQNDTIELMSMLFGQLAGELGSSPGARQLLGPVQVPMLRAALADPNFFVQSEHPGRRLLETLVDAGTRWLGGDDEDPALSRQLRALTRRVAHEYDGRSERFDEARREIEAQTRALSRRAEVAERRHIEAAQGRERLQLARQRARELIGERLGRGQANGLLRIMLNHTWTDVLSLTLLRAGEHSEAFQRRLQVTDQLLRLAETPDADARRELRTEIASGLGQVGIQGQDAWQIANKVTRQLDLPGEPKPAAPDTHAGSELPGPSNPTGETPVPAPIPSDSELAARLKRRPGSGAAAAEAIRRQPPLTPRTLAALDALTALPFGSWLLCLQPDNSMQRRKLAWHSPETGQCLIVNRRGVRCDGRNLRELARDMVNDLVKLPDHSVGSLVERAWQATVRGLRHWSAPMEATAENEEHEA